MSLSTGGLRVISRGFLWSIGVGLLVAVLLYLLSGTLGMSPGGWEVSAALLGAGATGAAAWIAATSLRAQQLALEQQEWLHLLDRRLQVREDLRALLATCQFNPEVAEAEGSGLKFAALCSTAPFLFGPDVAAVVEEARGVCSTYQGYRTGAKVTYEEGDPEGAADLAMLAYQLHPKLMGLRDELERVISPYLQPRRPGPSNRA